MAYAKNGRAKGQISLKGKGQRGFGSSPNAVQTTGLRGARVQKTFNGRTPIANEPNVTGGKTIRNSNAKNAPSANAGQTVGIRGAKVGYTYKKARVADSVPDLTTKNPSQYNTHVSSTIGLKGAGKPFAQQKRTTTQFDNVGDKVSKNSRKYNPHAAPTVGLRGAKLGLSGKGPRKGSNLGKAAGDKNSRNPYVNPPHANDTQGLTRASKKAPKQSLRSSGTLGKSGGGKGIAFMGNKRQVISTLRPQKYFVSGIPALVRRAAARAPSNGSSKPSFTSKVVKITSK